MASRLRLPSNQASQRNGSAAAPQMKELFRGWYLIAPRICKRKRIVKERVKTGLTGLDPLGYPLGGEGGALGEGRASPPSLRSAPRPSTRVALHSEPTRHMASPHGSALRTEAKKGLHEHQTSVQR